MADIDSILTSTKKMLGIPEEETAFDLDVFIHINSVLSTLTQLGIGPDDDQLIVTSKDTTWDELIGVQKNINMVKSYIFMRVKLMFDPPTTGFATDALERQIKESEWRLVVAASSVPNIPGTNVPTVPGPVQGKPSIWDLTGLEDFPSNAPVDAVGIDFVSGRIYRKAS